MIKFTDAIISFMKFFVFLVSFTFSFHLYAYDGSCDGMQIDGAFASSFIEDAAKSKEGKELRGLSLSELSEQKKITIAEDYAIKLYTDQGYKKINPPLRNKDKLSKKIEPFYIALCAALTKRPLFKGRVYRVSKLPKRIQKVFEENNTIIMKSFMSTSLSKEGVKVFKRNTNKKYNTVFYIESKTGRDISRLSSWKEEQEILFPAGKEFIITDTFRPIFSSKLYVWMEEI